MKARPRLNARDEHHAICAGTLRRALVMLLPLALDDLEIECGLPPKELAKGDVLPDAGVALGLFVLGQGAAEAGLWKQAHARFGMALCAVELALRTTERGGFDENLVGRWADIMEGRDELADIKAFVQRATDAGIEAT